MPYDDHHRAAGRGPASRSLLMLSVLLAYTTGPWLTVLDRLQSPHAGHDHALHTPLLLQALHDSTRLLPAVAAAVRIGFAIADRIRRSNATLSGRTLAVLDAAMVTLCTSAIVVGLAPVQSWIVKEAGGQPTAVGRIAITVVAVTPVALLVSAATLLAAAVQAERQHARARAGHRPSHRPPIAVRAGRLRPHRPTVAAALTRALRLPTRPRVATVLAAALGLALLPGTTLLTAGATAAAAPIGCGTLPGTRTITADVVALDQPFTYNRLGADNPEGMIYALRRDVVVKTGPDQGKALTLLPDSAAQPGNVTLRSDKRPRPLVLRANVGDCLEIHFQNLLGREPVIADPAEPPEPVDPANPGDAPGKAGLVDKPVDQPADRNVGIHVAGMQLVDSITSDGSFVGQGPSGLAAPGESRTYKLLAEHENTYLLSNPGVSVGGEAFIGTSSFGLFGAVNVEPFGTNWYRSQMTRAEMDLVTRSLTADGHPVIDYEGRYPADFPDPSKAGEPVVNMLDGNELVHSDLNAIISGPASDGYRIPLQDYPQTYWDNQNYNLNTLKGREPFREFTTIFHDEIFARQAFTQFNDPKYAHALAGVKDGFAINYGTGGIGSEIIANRLGVGPEWNCTDCKFEEFFLSAWAVGDPAMVVDVPANTSLVPGPKATKALYPDDPSNVHHSYINDRVKFRNLMVGKEHHIFHLHTHQWQFQPNNKGSNYLDSQIIGPGSGYTYEIAFGGSGNRNKTVGDAIFHCHFYPHFAQGMWEMWRSHDTFERGTVLDTNGRPAPGSRAEPDAEIQAGTPIPGIVPLPSLVMPPMPNAASTVVPYDLDGDGKKDSSQVDADGNGIADAAEGFSVAPASNPGFPFYVPGLAGHRPPTAPLDMVDANGDGQVEDGGLPRHIVTGGTAEHYETQKDFGKILKTAKVEYVPEGGTAAEKVAMAYHQQLWHASYRTDGTAVNDATPLPGPTGRPIKGYETNGLPPQPGAPYSDPCRTDATPADNWQVTPTGRARTYKGVAIQTDMVINKVGWHYPQQRMLTLWGDAGPTLARTRAPEPLVMRLNTNDCTTYWHANLVPNTYQLDDYQVRTPTDIVGQHIHLVKFDVQASDGSGNGFNYEDGTLSPQEVVERIDAVRAADGCQGDDHLDPGDTWTPQCPLARKHPYFGNVAGLGDLAWGARTTAQRWYADPVLNQAWDQGLGTVFTHDHFGPSTHQQVGLYATVLIEPGDSLARDPETGVAMRTRDDGGPTSWRADIYWPDGDARNTNAHREFFLEYGDYQHAYQAGGGKLTTTDNGAGVQIPTYQDFPNAINPSFRQEPPSGKEKDLYLFPNKCPDGSARPCPEAIDAADPGTHVVNYRNESVGLRVYDPATKAQTAGDPGDLSRAFESRTDRAIPALDSQPTTYPALTKDVDPGDPYTPLLRTYMGDKVLIRAQVGAHEEGHSPTVEGVKWLQDRMNPNSGWRDSVAQGISEYANFEVPIPTDLGPGKPTEVDHLYTMGASTDDLWNGTWGILRSYVKARSDLLKLPNNPVPSTGWTITNQSQFDETCPVTAPVRNFKVAAVRAADVLGPNGLVYNDRTTEVKYPAGLVQGAGPLIDPDALLFFNYDDIVWDFSADPLKVNGKPMGLKPGVPVEPLVMRADAGDCIKVELRNAFQLPTGAVPDTPGFNALPPIIHKDENADGAAGITTFNENDVRPSSLIGFHPQLVAAGARRNDGLSVGRTKLTKLIAPQDKYSYTWYAGAVDMVQVSGGVEARARPVEFGATNLSSTDLIEHAGKGLAAALVIEPPGSTWTTDAGSHLSASVTAPDTSFREHVTVLQDNLQLRYGSQCLPSDANLQCAVPDIATEGAGVAEDAEDSGQKAVNYGADPLWFRLGVTPDTPPGNLSTNTDIHRVYADELVGGDPETPVFTAKAGEPVRVRLLEPGGGHARGHVFTVHGHAWQREPYLDNSDRLNYGPPPADPTVLNKEADGISPGHNNMSWWVGAQEGMTVENHFDLLLPSAGGRFAVPGDYLFQDSASFGNYQGLWGILRVTP